MLFRNGSKAYIDAIEKLSGENHLLVLAFDNGSWIPSAGDYDFIFRGGEGITVECREGGLELPVPEGATWTVHQKLTGEGGVVKTGSGTLVFEQASYYDTYNNVLTAWSDTSSWAFTGAARIKEGTVEVKSGACPATASVVIDAGATFVPASNLAFGSVSGEGTVSGGGLVDTRISGVALNSTALTRPTIALEIDESGVVSGQPKFTDCTFEGTVEIDFGRTEETPISDSRFSFTLCTFDGNAPALGTVKAVNTGLVGVDVALSVDGNKVMASVSSHNFTLIFFK